MKKFFTSLAILFLVFSGFFASPVPSFAQDSTLNTGSALGGEEESKIESALNSCNIMTSFSLCILWLIYHVWLGLSTMVLGLAGKLFDYFISYSLDSNAYKSDFVTKGWALIRDLANVMFIFTLLYLAIKHILGGSAKNHIPMLIIVALLINFSLFFTKVAIDAGNILARAFYNSINIENDNSPQNPGYKSISLAVLDKINPQKLLSQDFFKLDLVTSGAYSTQNGQMIDTGSVSELETTLDQNFWYYAFIFILLGVINFILALTFLSMALLFLGRVIGLWFAMIFSPVAFITLAVPGMGGMVSRLNFGAWRDLVLKQAFLAPIVMFFIYLTVMFLQIMFTTITPPENQDTFMKIMGILIPFIFVVLILNTAKKVANDMSGDIGKTVKEWGGKAVGLVGGAALGATAFAGRRIIGAAAGRNLALGNYQERIQQAEQSGNTAEALRLTRKMKQMEKLYSSSFDIRNAGKAKGIAGWASRGIGSGLSGAITSFGGGKSNMGEGSKESRKKYIDEIKKERLDLAQELSEIGDNEDSQIRLRELRRQRANADIARRELIRTGQNTQAIDADIARYNADMARIQAAQRDISQTRRNLFANRVEDSVWESLISGIENRELHADEIRQGNRSRTPEQRALDAIRALNQPPPPPPATPPPPTNPPGGGNTTP